MTLDYALALDSTNADLQREYGIAPAKRGLKSHWRGYDEAALLDPIQWIGYRGYMHLYFNRDYERAIADFDALDTLTPGFTDYPQATSDKYMRAVAYMMLNQHATALEYFDDWLAEETASVEERYLGASVWLYRSILLDSVGQREEATKSIAHGLEVLEGESAELHYAAGRRAEAAGNFEVAKQHYQAGLANVRLGYTLSRPYVIDFYEVEARELREALARVE